MRLFNDMVSAVLHCDKPVVCRVNGMRVGGGQEVGMACDFSVVVISPSSARPGQSTDRCRWREHGFPSAVCRRRARHDEQHPVRTLDGAPLLLAWRPQLQIVPVLKLDGKWVAYLMVVTDRMLDEYGRVALGEWRLEESPSEARSS